MSDETTTNAPPMRLRAEPPRVTRLSRKMLAGVGAVPDQLAQLGDSVKDEPVQTELTLLIREANWQLRTLARETRRRWREQPEDDFPVPLRAWLDDVDAFVAKLAGLQDHAEGEPSELALDTGSTEEAPSA